MIGQEQTKAALRSGLRRFITYGGKSGPLITSLGVGLSQFLNYFEEFGGGSTPWDLLHEVAAEEGVALEPDFSKERITVRRLPKRAQAVAPKESSRKPWAITISGAPAGAIVIGTVQRTRCFRSRNATVHDVIIHCIVGPEQISAEAGKEFLEFVRALEIEAAEQEAQAAVRRQHSTKRISFIRDERGQLVGAEITEPVKNTGPSKPKKR
jgi:hypothetical protein